jgi:hypothetical protein
MTHWWHWLPRNTGRRSRPGMRGHAVLYDAVGVKVIVVP